MKTFRWLIFALIVLAFSGTARAQFPCTASPNIGFQIPNIGNTTTWGTCLNTDLSIIDSLLGGTSALGAGTATPSIAGATNWITANTAATTITNLTGGFPGQTVRLICGIGDTSTAVNTSSFINVVAPWACNSSTSLTLTLVGTVWTESARGIGGAGSMDTIANGFVYFKHSDVAGNYPIVYNGDFEATNTLPVPDWFPNPNVISLTYETATPYEGNQSLKMQCNNSGTGCGVFSNSNFFQVTPGDSFYIQAAIRTDGVVTGAVSVQFLDKTDTGIGSGIVAESNSTNWTLVSATGTAPAGSMFMFVQLENLPEGTAGTTEYDAIQVYKLNFPGNMLFTGNVTLGTGSALAAGSSGSSFTGTWGGAPTLTGSWSFTGGLSATSPQLTNPVVTTGSTSLGIDTSGGNYAVTWDTLSTARTLHIKDPGISSANFGETLAVGTLALGTATINTLTCASPVNTTVAGMTVSSTVVLTWSGSPSGAYLTGLHIMPPDMASGSFNVRVCNSTAGNLTPPSATLNYRVIQ